MAAKKISAAPGLGAIAAAAGVTRASVSYALRNKPGVSKTTRARILKIARQMGYSPDARIASWMLRVRESKSRELLPIAWLNHDRDDKDAWRNAPFLSPYFEGAAGRAGELGYRLEEIWVREPGMTIKRLSTMLYQRGIEGVINTHYIARLRLKWEHIAGVTLEHHLVAPDLPRVETDLNYNIFLAVKNLRKLGYRRIGFCFEEGMKSPANFTFWPIVLHLNSGLGAGQRIPPLLHPWSLSGKIEEGKRQAIHWMKRHRPEVVVCHNNRILDWAREAGIEVPRDMGVVHLATDDDVSDWAGIQSNRRLAGATAVDWVVSKILQRDFGIPKLSPITLIRGSWHTGRILRA